MLESFLSLGYASGETVTLGSLFRPESISPTLTASNAKIQKFATRYGGLEVFYRYESGMKWPKTLHVEHCDVWRYFARVMGALLRIAATFYSGGSGSREDWYAISKHPSVMRELAFKSDVDPLNGFSEGNEEAWLSVVYFADKDSSQTTVMLSHLVNILLGLGRVRPWLIWPQSARPGSRPKSQYTSSSLFSNLALQLWLLMSRAEAFAVCTHCLKQYIPGLRAPKAGQRRFCPDCREEGAPKEYARRDFRERQRRLLDGLET
ncbi:MAG: hypothetical protein ACKV22_12325 [Bryobacteraceae bacterium]